MNALVIEDDEHLGQTITKALQELFDEVVLCTNLVDAIAYRLSLAECPAVIWQDLILPGSDIPESFKETTELRKACPDSIIVIMTGAHYHNLVKDATTAGADSVAFKPFHFSIVDIVRTLAVGAINAMTRRSSSSLRVLENVLKMATSFYSVKHHPSA